MSLSALVHRVGFFTHCWNVPSTVNPDNLALAQSCSRPSRQYEQVKHESASLQTETCSALSDLRKKKVELTT